MMLNQSVISWRRNRRVRVSSNRIPPNTSLQVLLERVSVRDDADCLEKYRLDKNGLLNFSMRFHSALEPSTRAGISSLDQVKVALSFFGSGSSLQTLHMNYGIAPSTVYKIIVRVSKALTDICMDDFEQFPTADDLNRLRLIKDGFWDYSQFPSCLGAIDGTQIRIKAPKSNEEIYVNRKRYHSINVQLICSMNQEITSCTVKWPGLVHDSTIWNNSTICSQLNRSYTGWLIGDSGYPLREKLMVPFNNPTAAGEKKFNKSLKRRRLVVKRTIGVLKSRWRCLDSSNTGGLQFTPEVSCQVIGACIILHNYCIRRRLPYHILPHILNDRDDSVRHHDENEKARVLLKKGKNQRNEIIRLFFVT